MQYFKSCKIRTTSACYIALSLLFELIYAAYQFYKYFKMLNLIRSAQAWSIKSADVTVKNYDGFSETSIVININYQEEMIN